jgi:hypothetical protein
MTIHGVVDGRPRRPVRLWALVGAMQFAHFIPGDPNTLYGEGWNVAVCPDLYCAKTDAYRVRL